MATDTAITSTATLEMCSRTKHRNGRTQMVMATVTTRVGLKETVFRRMPNNGRIQTAMATVTMSTDSMVTSS